jgi:hypothetical protein
MLHAKLIMIKSRNHEDDTTNDDLKLSYKFNLPEGKASNTPAIPGTVMSKGEVKKEVNIKTQARY